MAKHHRNTEGLSDLGGEQFLMTNGEIVLPAEYTGNMDEFHYYNITCFHDFEIIPQFKPTHWMPLPQPPATDKEQKHDQ